MKRCSIKTGVFSPLLLTFLCISANVLSAQDAGLSAAYRDEELKTKILIQEMADIIHRSDNQYLKDLLDVVIPRFSAGDMPLFIMDRIEEYDESVLGNASFRYDVRGLSEPHSILLETRLLRFYPDRKSLVMAVIIHEFAHAGAFYSDTEAFLSSAGDVLEKYLYEMDSLYAEAQFIELCEAADYELSNFETFLLASLRDDNLANASLLLSWRDNRLTWEMVRLKESVLAGEITEAGAIEKTINLGNNLLTRFKGLEISADDDWVRFVTLVQLYTFDQFVAKTLNPTLSHEESEELAVEIEQVNIIKEEMVAVLKSNWDFMSAYSSDFTNWLYGDLE